MDVNVKSQRRLRHKRSSKPQCSTQITAHVFPVFFIVITSTMVIVSLSETGEQNINLALGKPASQSSSRLDSPADLAVDGITNGNWYAGSCTLTVSGNINDWWMVDLLANYTIVSITIFNRIDYRPDRLRDFELQIIADDLNTIKICKTVVGPLPYPSVSYECDEPATGRFVMLKKMIADPDPLSLCEVEVYGHPFVEKIPPNISSPELVPRRAVFIIVRHKGSVWLQNYDEQQHGQMLTNCARKRLRDERSFEELPYVQIDLADGGCRFVVDEEDSDESQSEDWVLVELQPSD